jgi:predicted DNA binding protein
MTFEIRIKAQHNCPFLEFSKHFGNKQIHSYCSREFDIVLVPCEITQDHINIAKSIFPKQLVDTWRITSSFRTNFIIMNCICESMYETTISSLIQRNGGMLNYPIIYEGGWEYHKILCVDKQVVSTIIDQLKSLPTYEILAINDLGIDGIFKSQMISVPEIISSLTERQISILVQAYERGYYEIPRKVRTQDLADSLEISRYGVDKNLRTAENKLIRSIVPYLYFRIEQYRTQSTQILQNQ